MGAKIYLLVGSLACALAVALGAFGAHALKVRLTDAELAIWQTAALYHFIHALALLVVGLWLLHTPNAALTRWAGGLFAFGIMVFSGSLYLLALSGVRWLGAITPVGGVAFIIGWLLLAMAAWQTQN